MESKATCGFRFPGSWRSFAARGALVAAFLAAVLGTGCAPHRSAWELGALDSERRLVLVGPTGRSRLLTATGGITDFSWSPDGLTLA
ncbi:MAG: hypothetical protein K6T75_08075, partial [Acetobacteraceae bacterium]|nr:hypothetical protein [Acetobacteraceae bacterium]